MTPTITAPNTSATSALENTGAKRPRKAKHEPRLMTLAEANALGDAIKHLSAMLDREGIAYTEIEVAMETPSFCDARHGLVFLSQTPHLGTETAVSLTDDQRSRLPRRPDLVPRNLRWPAAWSEITEDEFTGKLVALEKEADAAGYSAYLG